MISPSLAHCRKQLPGLLPWHGDLLAGQSWLFLELLLRWLLLFLAAPFDLSHSGEKGFCSCCATWSWIFPATWGDPPGTRFGRSHSSAALE